MQLGLETESSQLWCLIYLFLIIPYPIIKKTNHQEEKQSGSGVRSFDQNPNVNVKSLKEYSIHGLSMGGEIDGRRLDLHVDEPAQI
jgi:hypothetical protein